MFRNVTNSKPIDYHVLHNLTKNLAAAVGLDPAAYDTHSFRIGGATALFHAGAGEMVIRTMGRWSSDIYKLYIRCCFNRCSQWSRKAASTSFDSSAADFDEVDYY